MKLSLPTRFIRLCKPNEEGFAEVGTRQVYIFPTGYGFLFALLLCIMLVGSINYANNLGFLLTFILSGLGMVAMIHTWRNLVGLQISCTTSPPVFKGKPAHYPLTLKNNRDAERPAIQLEFHKGEEAECDLLEKGSHVLNLQEKTTRRGWHLIPRITASTQYPLGLFTAWSYFQLDSATLVYPAPGIPIELAQLPTYSRADKGTKVSGLRILSASEIIEQAIRPNISIGNPLPVSRGYIPNSSEAIGRNNSG